MIVDKNITDCLSATLILAKATNTSRALIIFLSILSLILLRSLPVVSFNMVLSRSCGRLAISVSTGALILEVEDAIALMMFASRGSKRLDHTGSTPVLMGNILLHHQELILLNF